MIDPKLKEFVPSEEQRKRTEYARLRAAIADLDASRQRIHDLGHTPATARERYAILRDEFDGGPK